MATRHYVATDMAPRETCNLERCWSQCRDGRLESAGQEHAGLGVDWHVAAFLYATFDVDLHTDGPGRMKLSYGVVKEAGAYPS